MRRYFFIPVLIMLIVLPGCWDYVELEQMALISCLGIDYDTSSRTVTVSVQYLLIESSQGSGSGSGSKPGSPLSKTAFKKASGLSVTDAIEELERVIGKRLFYGYMQTELIGEDAAKNIMEDIIGLNDRSPETRTTTYVAVTRGKAGDAVSTIEPDVTSASGKHIRDLIQNSIEYGYSLPVTKQDFAEFLALEGLEPVAPYITTETAVMQTATDIAGSENNRQKAGQHKVEGLAAFSGRHLAGFLDMNESIGFGLIAGKKIKPYETFKVSEDANTENTVSFRIIKSKSKIKVKLIEGKPLVDVNINAEAELRKYAKDMKYKILTPDVISILEEKLNESIYARARTTLEKVQKTFKSDIFGFGSAFYRQHPKVWRSQYEQSWEKVFPDVPVNIRVNVKIVDTGTNIMRFKSK